MARLLFLLLFLVSTPAYALPTDASPLRRSFRDCADCPQMIVIPAGDFTMGSPSNEPGQWSGETPQRRVVVRKFALGKFHVTRGQWAAFVTATNRPVTGGCAWASATRDTPDPEASWRKVEFPQDDDHPVVCVTWQDAQDYAAWLSRRTGHHYRLPAESEWEYAARAGTATAYYYGPAADHGHANYGKDTCCEGLAAGRDRWVQTSPVGAFPPNPFGLYDMQGNVMQWMQDCMRNYGDGPIDGSAYEVAGPLVAGPIVEGDLIGVEACRYRMLRGGDWGNPPGMVRSASRNYAPAPGSTNSIVAEAWVSGLHAHWNDLRRK